MNCILVDYENVQPGTLSLFDREDVRVIVFVGAAQSKVAFEVVSALQPLGDRARYVKITGNGSNALDFHIAFYMGELLARDPGICFYVLSKDSGFDPLVQHLRNRNVVAHRARDVREIVKAIDSHRTPQKPTGKTDAAAVLSERIGSVVADLKRRSTSLPRTTKTLSSTINAQFGKKLDKPELALLLEALQDCGVITVDGRKVSYHLQE